MVNLDTKIRHRYATGIKKYQRILKKAQASNLNESDTITIITDMLCDIMGYDKYDNITSEYSIKKTFCNLAIKINDKDALLIECKAIGVDLKEDLVRQAINHAADSGIEWSVLTNGIVWKIYKIILEQPIRRKLVCEFNMLELSAKKDMDLEQLYCLSIEAFSKTNCKNKPCEQNRTEADDTDVITAMTRITNNVCHSCILNSDCWEYHFYQSYKNILSILTTLEIKGQIKPEDIPASMEEKCAMSEKIIEECKAILEISQIETHGK